MGEGAILVLEELEHAQKETQKFMEKLKDMDYQETPIILQNLPKMAVEDIGQWKWPMNQI